MKKSLAALCILSVLALGALLGAHAWLASQQDRVTVRPETAAGDPAAARGVHVDVRHNFGDRVFWTSTVTAPDSVETAFCFSDESRPQISRNRDAGVWLYSKQSGGETWEWSGEEQDLVSYGSREMAQQELLAMEGAIREAAEKTPAGETFTKVYPMREFYDFYPMQAELRMWGAPYAEGRDNEAEQEYLVWAEIEDGREALQELESRKDQAEYQAPYADWEDRLTRLRILQELAEAFRFPVEERAGVMLSLTRDSEGRVSSIAAEDHYTDCTFYTPSILTPDYNYFVPMAVQSEGRLLDYSHTPAGYGVYRLPAYKEAPLTMEDLEMTCPLSEEELVQEIMGDFSGRRILVSTVDGERAVLRQLDSRTGEELSRETLFEMEPTDEDWTPWVKAAMLTWEGAVLAVGEDGHFCYLEQGADGTYVPRFRDTLPDWNRSFENITADSDGERLAIAASWGWDGDWELLVYDREGLLYRGFYWCSLMAEHTYTPGPVLDRITVHFGPHSSEERETRDEYYQYGIWW